MSPPPADLHTDPSAAAQGADAADVGAALDAVVAELVPVVLPGINDAFADSLLLVARILGGHPGAALARASSLDRRGVDLVATVEGAETAVRVDFAQPVSSIDELRTALLDI